MIFTSVTNHKSSQTIKITLRHTQSQIIFTSVFLCFNFLGVRPLWLQPETIANSFSIGFNSEKRKSADIEHCGAILNSEKRKRDIEHFGAILNWELVCCTWQGWCCSRQTDWRDFYLAGLFQGDRLERCLRFYFFPGHPGWGIVPPWRNIRSL